MSAEQAPRPVEPLPTGSGPRTTWYVPHLATTVVDEPFTGWLSVYADADARAVYLTDPEDHDGLLEPDEARALARALVLAADHAEDHHSHVMQTSSNLSDVLSPLMGDQENETKRAAHDAVRAFSNDAFHRRDAALDAQRERARAAAGRTR